MTAMPARASPPVRRTAHPACNCVPPLPGRRRTGERLDETIAAEFRKSGR
jgi:hypothetical protein